MFRHVQLHEVQHLPGQLAAQVADDVIGDSHRHQTQSNGPEDQPLAGAGDRDVGDLSRERGIAGILGVHEADSVLEIQRVNDVGLALVQVHRAWVRCGRGLTDAHAAQEPPGSGLHDDDLATDSPPDIHGGMRFHPGRRKVPAVPAPQQPVVNQTLRHLNGAPGPDLGVV
ncbi:Uncharacterised protein [Mycobacterium tuberculosis]|uniref:Uncharacterized protein n=1 Tax=Mycobacterium tuberculosis TaxID=1773 RepID=A0A655A035_MYCTX|nr:Uncharacterised protein [Mycobacterium tuberculosis]